MAQDKADADRAAEEKRMEAANQKAHDDYYAAIDRENARTALW